MSESSDQTITAAALELSAEMQACVATIQKHNDDQAIAASDLAGSIEGLCATIQAHAATHPEIAQACYARLFDLLQVPRLKNLSKIIDTLLATLSKYQTSATFLQSLLEHVWSTPVFMSIAAAISAAEQPQDIIFSVGKLFKYCAGHFLRRKDFEKPIWDSARALLNSAMMLTPAQRRYVSLEHIRAHLLQLVDSVLQHLVDSLLIAEQILRCRFIGAGHCLDLHLLNRRLEGIKEMEILCQWAVDPSQEAKIWINSRRLLPWIDESDLLPRLLARPDERVLSRCASLWQVLATENYKDQELIEMLWNATLDQHGSVVDSLYEALVEVVKHSPGQLFFRKAEQLMDILREQLLADTTVQPSSAQSATSPRPGSRTAGTPLARSGSPKQAALSALALKFARKLHLRAVSASASVSDTVQCVELMLDLIWSFPVLPSLQKQQHEAMAAAATFGKLGRMVPRQLRRMVLGHRIVVQDSKPSAVDQLMLLLQRVALHWASHDSMPARSAIVAVVFHRTVLRLNSALTAVDTVVQQLGNDAGGGISEALAATASFETEVMHRCVAVLTGLTHVGAENVSEELYSAIMRGVRSLLVMPPPNDATAIVPRPEDVSDEDDPLTGIQLPDVDHLMEPGAAGRHAEQLTDLVTTAARSRRAQLPLRLQLVSARSLAFESILTMSDLQQLWGRIRRSPVDHEATDAGDASRPLHEHKSPVWIEQMMVNWQFGISVSEDLLLYMHEQLFLQMLHDMCPLAKIDSVASTASSSTFALPIFRFMLGEGKAPENPEAPAQWVLELFRLECASPSSIRVLSKEAVQCMVAWMIASHSYNTRPQQVEGKADDRAATSSSLSEVPLLAELWDVMLLGPQPASDAALSALTALYRREFTRRWVGSEKECVGWQEDIAASVEGLWAIVFGKHNALAAQLRADSHTTDKPSLLRQDSITRLVSHGTPLECGLALYRLMRFINSIEPLELMSKTPMPSHALACSSDSAQYHVSVMPGDPNVSSVSAAFEVLPISAMVAQLTGAGTLDADDGEPGLSLDQVQLLQERLSEAMFERIALFDCTIRLPVGATVGDVLTTVCSSLGMPAGVASHMLMSRVDAGKRQPAMLSWWHSVRSVDRRKLKVTFPLQRLEEIAAEMLATMANSNPAVAVPTNRFGCWTVQPREPGELNNMTVWERNGYSHAGVMEYRCSPWAKLVDSDSSWNAMFRLARGTNMPRRASRALREEVLRLLGQAPTSAIALSTLYDPAREDWASVFNVQSFELEALYAAETACGCLSPPVLPARWIGLQPGISNPLSVLQWRASFIQHGLQHVVAYLLGTGAEDSAAHSRGSAEADHVMMMQRVCLEILRRCLEPRPSAHIQLKIDGPSDVTAEELLDLPRSNDLTATLLEPVLPFLHSKLLRRVWRLAMNVVAELQHADGTNAVGAGPAEQGAGAGVHVESWSGRMNSAELEVAAMHEIMNSHESLFQGQASDVTDTRAAPASTEGQVGGITSMPPTHKQGDRKDVSSKRKAAVLDASAGLAQVRSRVNADIKAWSILETQRSSVEMAHYIAGKCQERKAALSASLSSVTSEVLTQAFDVLLQAGQTEAVAQSISEADMTRLVTLLAGGVGTDKWPALPTLVHTTAQENVVSTEQGSSSFVNAASTLSSTCGAVFTRSVPLAARYIAECHVQLRQAVQADRMTLATGWLEGLTAALNCVMESLGAAGNGTSGAGDDVSQPVSAEVLRDMVNCLSTVLSSTIGQCEAFMRVCTELETETSSGHDQADTDSRLSKEWWTVVSDVRLPSRVIVWLSRTSALLLVLVRLANACGASDLPMVDSLVRDTPALADADTVVLFMPAVRTILLEVFVEAVKAPVAPSWTVTRDAMASLVTVTTEALSVALDIEPFDRSVLDANTEELLTMTNVLNPLSRKHSDYPRKLLSCRAGRPFRDVDTGYTGLVNLGATCYINSVLQQLYMIPAVRYAILSAPPLPDALSEKFRHSDRMLLLRSQLQQTFLQLRLSFLSDVDPTPLIKALQDDPPGFFPLEATVTDQNDANEFFSLFLDRLGQLFPGCAALDAAHGVSTTVTSKEGPAAMIPSNPVESVVSGLVEHQLIGKGQGCTHRRSRHEPFACLSVQVRGNNGLLDSLQEYTTGETLSGDNAYECSECNRKVDTVKRVCLRSLPPHLVFHLKRFDLNFDTLMKEKLNSRFTFPTELDLFPFTADGLEVGEQAQDGEQAPNSDTGTSPDASSTTSLPHLRADQCQYRLHGVIVHDGFAEYGHYYSYIRKRSNDDQDSSDATWFILNDERVMEVTEESVLEETVGGSGSCNAFMLIYDRMEDRPGHEHDHDAATPSAAKDTADQDNTTVEPPAGGSPKRQRTDSNGDHTSSEHRQSTHDACNPYVGQCAVYPALSNRRLARARAAASAAETVMVVERDLELQLRNHWVLRAARSTASHKGMMAAMANLLDALAVSAGAAVNITLCNPDRPQQPIEMDADAWASLPRDLCVLGCAAFSLLITSMPFVVASARNSRAESVAAPDQFIALLAHTHKVDHTPLRRALLTVASATLLHATNEEGQLLSFSSLVAANGDSALDRWLSAATHALLSCAVVPKLPLPPKGALVRNISANTLAAAGEVQAVFSAAMAPFITPAPPQKRTRSGSSSSDDSDTASLEVTSSEAEGEQPGNDREAADAPNPMETDDALEGGGNEGVGENNEAVGTDTKMEEVDGIPLSTDGSEQPSLVQTRWSTLQGCLRAGQEASSDYDTDTDTTAALQAMPGQWSVAVVAMYMRRVHQVWSAAPQQLHRSSWYARRALGFMVPQPTATATENAQLVAVLLSSSFLVLERLWTIALMFAGEPSTKQLATLSAFDELPWPMPRAELRDQWNDKDLALWAAIYAHLQPCMLHAPATYREQLANNEVPSTTVVPEDMSDMEYDGASVAPVPSAWSATIDTTTSLLLPIPTRILLSMRQFADGVLFATMPLDPTCQRLCQAILRHLTGNSLHASVWLRTAALRFLQIESTQQADVEFVRAIVVTVDSLMNFTDEPGDALAESRMQLLGTCMRSWFSTFAAALLRRPNAALYANILCWLRSMMWMTLPVTRYWATYAAKQMRMHDMASVAERLCASQEHQQGPGMAMDGLPEDLSLAHNVRIRQELHRAIAQEPLIAGAVLDAAQLAMEQRGMGQHVFGRVGPPITIVKDFLESLQHVRNAAALASVDAAVDTASDTEANSDGTPLAPDAAVDAVEVPTTADPVVQTEEGSACPPGSDGDESSQTAAQSEAEGPEAAGASLGATDVACPGGPPPLSNAQGRLPRRQAATQAAAAIANELSGETAHSVGRLRPTGGGGGSDRPSDDDEESDDEDFEDDGKSEQGTEHDRSGTDSESESNSGTEEIQDDRESMDKGSDV